MISILKTIYEYELSNKQSIRKKLRLWLLSHPQLNFYKFSINHLFRLATSHSRLLPNFIIIGSSKSGTTSMASYLNQHPNIYAVSDVHFFEYIITNNIKWYKSHFPTNFHNYYSKLKTKYPYTIGEHTATYLFHPLVPMRIKQIIPHVKLIILLRNPVDRAYSNYQHQVRVGLEIRTFEDSIKTELKRIELTEENKKIKIDNPDFDNSIIFSYLRHGIYIDKLKAWMNFFPKDQFLILNTEQFDKNTDEVLKKTYEFLNVPYYKIKNLEKQNVGKYDKMKESTRKFLIEFYRPHNQRLYAFLGKNFDWDK